MDEREIEKLELFLAAQPFRSWCCTCRAGGHVRLPADGHVPLALVSILPLLFVSGGGWQSCSAPPTNYAPSHSRWREFSPAPSMKYVGGGEKKKFGRGFPLIKAFHMGFPFPSRSFPAKVEGKHKDVGAIRAPGLYAA